MLRLRIVSCSLAAAALLANVSAHADIRSSSAIVPAKKAQDPGHHTPGYDWAHDDKDEGRGHGHENGHGHGHENGHGHHNDSEG